MGQTAGGLPWPEGTDLVRDGDNSIRALADALEARGHGLRIEARKITVSVGLANGQVSFAWQTPFGGAPIVMAMAGHPLTVASLNGGIPPDAGGCTIHVRYADTGQAFTGNAEIWYIAIGPKQ